MPLLFAVTLFVSASLLFMVQPMVGKLVLPLLGGSPAVWNACMVFFQALLLLGYLYADRLTRLGSTRKQWVIHVGVMALPVAAFALAVLFGPRHTPIGVAESLAPTDGSSAILSVLAILTVAIGVPFFVVSTSATLLQKWFTYTGHPSARDPYFLYAASNFGSLISLLGYPIFIEPNMTQGMQTWFWAAGFVALFGLIAFCGRAAVNPLGVPPGGAAGGKGGGKPSGGQSGGKQPGAAAAPAEPPLTRLRMAKWTLLAFVPSSLMLGVTFHMTTDIASIPLLWVGPLALYLVTFIIAFGRTPPWFRVLIGNLAPVMILLLVFLMISGVNPGVGLSLMLHLLTFFAAALMCHYELARDRPAPQYLTTYFLIMSLGGVLGGIFNSLLAPLVFPLAYEYPLALIVACFMVPKLLPDGDDGEPAAKPAAAAGRPKWVLLGGWLVGEEDDFWPVVAGSGALAVLGGITTLPAYRWFTGVVAIVVGVVAYNVAYLFLWKPFWAWYQTLPSGARRRVALALDVVIPVALGVAVWQLPRLLADSDWYKHWITGLAALTDRGSGRASFLTPGTINIVALYALPVMVCFFFVDRPVRFALCVAAILGPATYKEAGSGAVHTERSFFGILKIEENVVNQYLFDRTKYDNLNDEALAALRKAVVPEPVLQKLMPLKDRELPRHDFQKELAGLLTADELRQYEETVLKHTFARANSGDDAVRREDGKPIVLGQYKYRRLVHGTTLHGTQVAEHQRHILDDFQFLTAANPLENVAVMGAIQNFDMRQEPLTYYHRTGPVGAMFRELTRRGKDKEHVAMVGLGTGSVACYAQKGQKLTFYEIDSTVKKLVADTDKYFTYVTDARNRGAELDFRMGDARLKLKGTDDKYALLLVDAFSSDSIPVHLLTVEAVQLYLERLKDDGILALHISNKYVKLEPVVAAIADQLGLVARVWNDDSEGRHGKTASSWVALARRREDLGDRLCSPIGDWVGKYGRYGEKVKLIEFLTDTYPELQPLLNKATSKRQEALLQWLDKRTDDPVAKQAAGWIRSFGTGEYTELMQILRAETGFGFRPLRPMKTLAVWTDDYADVMRVMMISELQGLRRFFGLPTLDDE